MRSGTRYWVMIGVLFAAVIGMKMMSHGEATPAALPLMAFPREISGYSAVADVPFDKGSLEILNPTDYMNRYYFKPGAGEIGLYIAYFASQRTGTTIHSPKNCLPGSGWQPTISTIEDMTLSDGRKVPVNRYVIAKGLEKEVVLYWYQAHGRVVASEYWGKLYMVYDALRLNRTDAALVRVMTPVQNGDVDGAQERATVFAKQVALDVEKIIPR